MRLTMHIPDELKKRYHLACIERSETMSERTAALITKWLEQVESEKPKAKKR